ncbi:MAG: hypothetical protein IJX35_00155 [Candidatus Methanomethylophilaceae archaeon]|nr:hypothetical protein [Candidatus Methanomethylophilaceae archaeon]
MSMKDEEMYELIDEYYRFVDENEQKEIDMINRLNLKFAICITMSLFIALVLPRFLLW